ncbi:MAG: hypothetical protein H6819_03805 [Phycisphaerales bacterium]|nr:hypothetical protein [Phycisphaerales bacterium]MCB9856323.1 hypothetical protein [Phycisphaerales bacterium]
MAGEFEQDDIAGESSAAEESGPSDMDLAPEPEVSGRREFLLKTARRAAYVAPVVLLFKPREAVAGSGGSAITPGP